MSHIVEEAKSGRSKCRGCNQSIAKGELRFGERLPNPFADEGDMTLWFHLTCGAMRRPESFEEILEDELITDAEVFAEIVALGKRHYRLERIAGVQLAPSGRARCRHCREMIEKEAWRIPLVFFEEGMFNSSGYVHVTCAEGYFETKDILDRLVHFTPDLTDIEQAQVAQLLT